MCLPTGSGKRLPSTPSNQTDPEVRQTSYSVGLAGPLPGRSANRSPAISADIKMNGPVALHPHISAQIQLSYFHSTVWCGHSNTHLSLLLSFVVLFIGGNCSLLLQPHASNRSNKKHDVHDFG